MIKKYRLNILMAALMCTTLLSSCSESSVLQTETASQTASAEAKVNASAVASDMIIYDTDDYYTDWKDKNPNYIELSGGSAQFKGSGAAQSGNKVTITKAGTYVISGKMDNGQIVVDVKDKGIVRLVLNGVDITCSDNAPIYVMNAEKTVISLQEGTLNNITDGKSYILADKESDEPNGAIYSKDSLTFNGAGTLTVHGNYNNGITSKDDLKITGGNISIYSADDGLMGKDMVLIKAGNINIDAGGDGIKSTNDTDAQKGFIALEGGTYNIKAGTDGIQAETSVLVTGGEFTVITGGGSANADPNANTALTKSTEEESQSAKAIKAIADITIKGGTFKIDSLDDAVHSNSSVNIEAGDISIVSGDDGIHSDSLLTIKGGKVNISKSYEGIESEQITISDGEVNITASDDGVNVSGGKDQSAMNERPGQNTFTSSGNSKLNIDGGYISVNAMGDGLDSNGSIYMTGGTVVVSGPTNNGNGALDYDGVFEMSGGKLIAAGSSGMAQTPSEESTQNSIIMNFSNVQQAGTIVHLEDSEGNTVATYAPEKQYQSVVICSPELKKGTTYTLYSGGTSTGSKSAGLYKTGEYQNGNKIVDFTISSTVTWLNETGVTTSKSNNPGGQNGPGFGGGQKPQGMERP